MPPCAVACVTSCDINFVVNLVLTICGVWVGGVLHAIVMVVVFGFNEKELPRERRAKRLAGEREADYVRKDSSAPRERLKSSKKSSAPPPPLYDTRPPERRVLAPTYTPQGAGDGGGGVDLGAYPTGGDEYGQSSGGAGQSYQYGEDRKNM